MTPAWDRDALVASPRFAGLHAILPLLPADRAPTLDELSALAAARAVGTADGRPVRFVSADGPGDYETRIAATGEVPTRASSRHDLFNALAWLAFPRAKAALNRLHGEHRRIDARRGTARDVLTLFDEDGLLMATADPSLGALLRDFRWRELFVARRADVVRRTRFLGFGHALHEKLLAPFHGLTAKVIVIELAPEGLAAPPAEWMHALDAALAARLGSAETLASTRALAPLPVLGIPGWWPANEDPAYYDDVTQFRAGRRR